MNPLIITATIANSWLNPQVKFPTTPDEIAETAKRCQQEGASIVHFHATGQWKETIKAIKKKTNILIQSGMSSLQIEERKEVFDEHSDMISIILGHHDEAFPNNDVYVLHSREELEKYSRLCIDNRVKPEFELWHSGHIWNLEYLIDKDLLKKPYYVTLFFGWPGGNWSPPTVNEYLYRRTLLPDNCLVSVSIMGAEQPKIISAAITNGDHVRIGTEDYPFLKVGEPKEPWELVAWTKDLANLYGREVSTVSETRKTLNI